MKFVCVGSALALSASLLLSISSGQSAPVAKKSARKPAKPIAKKALKPVVAGLTLKGDGESVIEATMSSKGANLVRNSFRSELKKDKRIFSAGSAAVNNGIAVLVMLPQTERRKLSEQLSDEMGATITFASRGGFRAGQTFPVVPATSPKVGTGIPLCFMSLVQYEHRKTGSGINTRYKTRQSTWVARSGVVRLHSVTAGRITFSIKNVRLDAFKSEYNTIDQARGSFTFNAIGQFTITEVDDGFR